jgi:hypothetical protein
MTATKSRKNRRMISSVLSALEPKVLAVIGEESKRNGTDKLTSRQINEIIKTVRAQKSKR